MIAKVIVDMKHKNINQTFDYFVKPEDEEVIKKGMRVIVPFTDHDLKRQGLVYDLCEESDVATKYIDEIIDLEPVVDEEIFTYIKYLTLNPTALLAKAVETVIPLDLVLSYQKKVTLLDQDIKDDLKSKFNRKNEWILKSSDKKYYQRLLTLKEKNKVKIETILKQKVAKKYDEYIELLDYRYQGTELHQKVISIVKSYESISRRYLNLLTSSGVVNTLIKKKVLGIVEKEQRLTNYEELIEQKPIDLLKENQTHYEKIQKSKLKEFVFEGSNLYSTNLIYKLVEETIYKQKQVLILVPERFLVNKYVDIYQKLFPNELITILDSNHTVKQTYFYKKAILEKESLITVGTRSSVFDKFNDLGLVIALQSHDSAYVQTDGIYYDARDVARLKAKFYGATLIYETHTRTLKQAKEILDKKLVLIEFEKAKEAFVDIVDMKDELLRGNTKMLSHSLKTYIDSAIKNDQKTLLIMNQKGYAPFVMCRSCGYVPKDKETDIPLNYSEKENILRSNLTKYQEPFSKTCPVCHKETMKPVGSGIEQLEVFLEKIYDRKTLLRIDGDTLSNKEVYEIAETLETNKDIKIIIGTQMALKDIFAKKVSLVGILMADQFLKVPRYDASENAYILFKNAHHIASHRLVIQSYQTDHVVIESLKHNLNFYDVELQNRKLTSMPPYFNLLQIRVEYESYLKAYQYAFMLKNEILSRNYKVIGPSPSLVLKNDRAYRFLLLVKYQTLDQALVEMLRNERSYNLETSFELIWN
ncbi:replication restart helicase PriA [Acholeplasma hippikon]|uniref:Primosomal protein N n=1 Tax=Acholeplasma hippikon TaxID=264636 RepID=A0A449BJR9_9MOLU|nr:primosomal protein N' [Acholeplasma hippikon]VEU82670.1 Primosomal protein N' [Acholeplasma hippikon]